LNLDEMIALIALCVLATASAQTIVQVAVATPQLSTLVTVLSLPAYAPILNLLNAPGTYTVFAPNNAAFQQANIDPNNVKLVSNVLQYHVLGARVNSGDLRPGFNIATTLMTERDFVNIGGRGQNLNVFRTGNEVSIYTSVMSRASASNVVVANVQCSNGVVHIIDRVLFFPLSVASLLPAAGLNQLLNAAVRAGLVGAVNNTASLTIFAPTDEAFSRVPGLPNLTPAQLAAILTYHVVPAVAYSTQISDGQSVPTLNGRNLVLNIRGQNVQISGTNGALQAEVSIPNVPIVNGVVHVIDRVMIPPQLAEKYPELLNQGI